MSQILNIKDLNKIARDAGQKILEVYERFDSSMIETKEDNSPLTLADKAAQDVIAPALEKLTPEIPVISEEGKDIPFENRKDWTKFWLVDPLDGTKEFIKRNGEFTVNIALVDNGRLTMGIIYAPVLDILYYADSNGAFKEENGKITALKVNKKTKGLVAVGSRSHAAPEDEAYLKQFDVVENVTKGSSLKFCLVAEGSADIYYRSGPTMEWDTAAGQAIIEHAGGTMTDTEGKPFVYNKPVLRNGGFVVKGFL